MLYIYLLPYYQCIGSDYSSGPYPVTIPAGENDVTFSVTITDDDILEMSETFNLIIDPSSLPSGVTSSNNTTVTILDQDGEYRQLSYYDLCLLQLLIASMYNLINAMF